MSKPFEPRWAVLVRVGDKWHCCPRHRFWFKQDAEQEARRKHAINQRLEPVVVEGDQVDTLLLLLNG